MLFAIDLGASVSIASAVVATVVALIGVLGYQNRRSKLATVRSAFSDAVGALASGDRERQLAGAVLLRRFFDPSSEFGVRDLVGRRRAPYSAEAVSVIAAVLRGMRTGDLQKLLADGLSYARTLEGADLQRTNLQGAYLSPRFTHGTVARADFYRADLSAASLKGAKAPGAVFYQARLRSTVFRGADLREANFFEADLTGAVFKDAHLHGATFAGARNVPVELAPFVDAEHRYISSAPAPAPEPKQSAKGSIFLSVPSDRTPTQEAVLDRLATLLRDRGFETETLPRTDYPPSDAMGEIYRRLTGCVGAVVLGLRRGSDNDATVGSTPWTHLEAGMAYACNLPLLIVREPGVESGAFDSAVSGHRTHMLDLRDSWDDASVLAVLSPWLSELVGSA